MNGFLYHHRINTQSSPLRACIVAAWVMLLLANCGGSNSSNNESPPKASSGTTSSSVMTSSLASSSAIMASSSLGKSSSSSWVSSSSSWVSSRSSWVNSSSSANPLLVGDANRGQTQFLLMCADCHGNTGQGAVPINASLYTQASLADYISRRMPKATPEDCVSECAANTAAFILAGFRAGSSAAASSSGAQASQIAGAVTKRLTADMLQASVGIAVGKTSDGDIAWTITSSRRATDGIEQFAQTLGRPDYVEITDEIREPTTLYAKLIGDLALDVCAKAITADYANGSVASDRNLVRFSALDNTKDAQTIAANIRYLKLRYHAQWIPPEGNDDSAALQQVFNAVAAQSTAKEGWQAVCVALLTSPQFHLY